MSIDTLLDTAPALSRLRSRKVARPDIQQAEIAPATYKRMPASELLKALLGIRDRQRKVATERVQVRMSVVRPDGRPAISLWLNGRDSLA